MATGGKKHMGRGSQGKGSGTGAKTTLDKDMVGENDVLSNRDKKQRTEQRGLDGSRVKSDQYQDHAANRFPRE